MSLGFFSLVLTSVLVLISFENNVCFSITILLLTCAWMTLGRPNRLYFAAVPISLTCSEFFPAILMSSTYTAKNNWQSCSRKRRSFGAPFILSTTLPLSGPRSNMIPKDLISQNAPEILSGFDSWVWIWISIFFFFFLRTLLRFSRGVAPRFADSGR